MEAESGAYGDAVEGAWGRFRELAGALAWARRRSCEQGDLLSQHCDKISCHNNALLSQLLSQQW